MTTMRISIPLVAASALFAWSVPARAGTWTVPGTVNAGGPMLSLLDQQHMTVRWAKPKLGSFETRSRLRSRTRAA
ncbi:MAG: hypothetical protein ABI768_07705 [Acidobacteriota bacterium]